MKLLAAGSAGLLALTLAAVPALADPTGPAPPPYRELVGFGSESTSDIMSAMSNAIVDGAGAKIIGSYDGPGPHTTKDPITHPQCQVFPPPSGSSPSGSSPSGSSGVTLLINDRRQSHGCIQFARSSSDNSASFPGSGLTWIPFAGNGVTYVVRSDGNISRQLTATELSTIYHCGGPAAPTVPDATRVRPVLPQFGSETRREFLKKLGMTDSATFVTQPGHTCVRDTKVHGGPVIENVGTELVDRREIAPHAIAPYVEQLNTVVPDVRGRTVLGHVNGVASVILNSSSPLRGDLYIVVPSELLGVAPYSTTFVGPGSAICSNTAIIKQYGFATIPDCGETARGDTGERFCPDLPEYPTTACTGVPPGTELVTLANNVDGVAYHVTNPGEIIDGKHIAGSLIITAANVIVRNSLIDGAVVNDYAGVVYPFSIMDSTVGPAEGCETAPGVGDGDYSAVRVLVRNHGDGFRASSDDVTIRDSFVDLCSNPNDHSDGIQTFSDGRSLTFDHNTVEQRGVIDMNAPIFIGGGWLGVSVTNNLVAGGTYSIQVFDLAGPAIVRGNRVVSDSWVYGPASSQCSAIEWSDNKLVRVDTGYRVTATVGSLQCE